MKIMTWTAAVLTVLLVPVAALADGQEVRVSTPLAPAARQAHLLNLYPSNADSRRVMWHVSRMSSGTLQDFDGRLAAAVAASSSTRAAFRREVLDAATAGLEPACAARQSTTTLPGTAMQELLAIEANRGSFDTTAVRPAPSGEVLLEAACATLRTGPGTAAPPAVSTAIAHAPPPAPAAPPAPEPGRIGPNQTGGGGATSHNVGLTAAALGLMAFVMGVMTGGVGLMAMAGVAMIGAGAGLILAPAFSGRRS